MTMLPDCPTAPPLPSPGDAVRNWARWCLRDSIEMLESARERQAQIAQYRRGRELGDESEAVSAWLSLADAAVEAATLAVVRGLLLVNRQARDLDEIDAGGFEWRDCGASVGEKLAWLEPERDERGQTDYRLCNAKLTIVDLCGVQELDRKRPRLAEE